MSFPLSSPRERCYPDDFIVSRIRGRATGLKELSGPEPSLEHEWVYERMRPALRRGMALYFLHSELWRVFICLRYTVKGKSVSGMGGLMRGSVLSREFRDALAEPLGCLDAVRMLSDVMLRPSGAGSIEPSACARLSTQGLMALEREVYSKVIKAGASSRIEGVRGYFSYMADRYNLLGLIKSMRLGLSQRPVLVEGGSLKPDALARAFDERRGDILAAMAERLTGEKFSGGAALMHHSFTLGLLRRMRRLERGCHLYGALIAHLVRASVAVEDRRVGLLNSDAREALA